MRVRRRCMIAEDPVENGWIEKNWQKFILRMRESPIFPANSGSASVELLNNLLRFASFISILTKHDREAKRRKQKSNVLEPIPDFEGQAFHFTGMDSSQFVSIHPSFTAESRRENARAVSATCGRSIWLIANPGCSLHHDVTFPSRRRRTPPTRRRPRWQPRADSRAVQPSVGCARTIFVIRAAAGCCKSRDGQPPSRDADRKNRNTGRSHSRRRSLKQACRNSSRSRKRTRIETRRKFVLNWSSISVESSRDLNNSALIRSTRKSRNPIKS